MHQLTRKTAISSTGPAYTVTVTCVWKPLNYWDQRVKKPTGGSKAAYSNTAQGSWTLTFRWCHRKSHGAVGWSVFCMSEQLWLSLSTHIQHLLCRTNEARELWTSPLILTFPISSHPHGPILNVKFINNLFWSALSMSDTVEHPKCVYLQKH